MENHEIKSNYLKMGILLLLTIKESTGYTQSIVIPNENEETIKKAIAQIHTEGYIDYNYNDGYGSYFDQISWKNVSFTISKLRVLS